MDYLDVRIVEPFVLPLDSVFDDLDSQQCWNAYGYLVVLEETDIAFLCFGLRYSFDWRAGCDAEMLEAVLDAQVLEVELDLANDLVQFRVDDAEPGSLSDNAVVWSWSMEGVLDDHRSMLTVVIVKA